MRDFWHFIQYHNAVPIALGIVVLGAGATFAATDPQAIYDKQQQVIAVDNTYIASKDLSTYSPIIEIQNVTEDADNYYVAYKLATIDVEDYVWKDVVRTDSMTVSKADLGPYRDLGVYVTGQLRQIVGREKQRLAEAQDIERKNITQKTVAIAYGGLVGKFLNDTTETLPGYTPVVVPPAPESSQVASAAASGGSGQQSGAVAQSSGGTGPLIQILGNNPAEIPLKTTYVDLGVVVSDAQGDNLGVHLFLDGKPVNQIQIDTSATSTHTIRYESTDPRGNTSFAERGVIVYDQAHPGVLPPQVNTPPIIPVVQSQSTTPAPTPAASSTPATTTPSSTPTPPPPTDTASSTATTTPNTASSTTATTTPPVTGSTTSTGSGQASSSQTSASSTASSTPTSSSTASSTPPATGTTASTTPATGTATSTTP